MSNPNEIELPNLLGDVLDTRLSEVRGAVICEVLEFDRTNQTARVHPVVLNEDNTRPADVRDVPVVFPGAYHDLQIGTFGVLLTGNVNPRRWWTGSGVPAAPEDDSRHELSTGVFLPDLRPQGNPRSLDADTSVLLRPTAGGEVRLGTHNANKAALHEDLTTDLDTFLGLLDTWGAAVGVAAGVAWTGQPIQAAIQALIGGAYQSPSVKVED